MKRLFKPRDAKGERRVFKHGFQQLPQGLEQGRLPNPPGTINIDMKGAHVRICREIMAQLGMNTTPLRDCLSDKTLLPGGWVSRSWASW